MVDQHNKILNAWWPKTPLPGNFGDILTPLLIKQLFNYECVFTNKPFNKPTLIGVGSIISHAENKTIVWGSGAMRQSIPVKRDAIYLSVRGPVTRDILKRNNIECPEVYGDPALIMPKIYSPINVDKIYEYGIFAHYVDTKQIEGWYNNVPTIKIINPLNANPLRVIDEVLKCNKIISSSLHGVIIAHAYDIPAVWVKHSDKLNGDGTKFRDYFESVGLKTECFDFKRKIDPKGFEDFNYQVGIKIDVDQIVSALQEYLGSHP
jgi:hypothetical protein